MQAPMCLQFERIMCGTLSRRADLPYSQNLNRSPLVPLASSDQNPPPLAGSCSEEATKVFRHDTATLMHRRTCMARTRPPFRQRPAARTARRTWSRILLLVEQLEE